MNPQSDNPASLKFNVTTFVAGKNLLAFYLEQQGNDSGVQQALPAKITTVSGNKVFGQKITISIPANLQQPAPGVYSTLIQIKNSLGLKSGSERAHQEHRLPEAARASDRRQGLLRPEPEPAGGLLGLLDGRRDVLGQGPLGHA